MKFGTIGASAVALAFGREALARGRDGVLSSRRGPDALVDKVAELGRGASAASVEEAASLDYVLLALPWRNVEAALTSLPAWNGRVLIDDGGGAEGVECESELSASRESSSSSPTSPNLQHRAQARC